MEFFYFLVTGSKAWEPIYHANFFNGGGFSHGVICALIIGAVCAIAFYFGCCNSNNTSKLTKIKKNKFELNENNNENNVINNKIKNDNNNYQNEIKTQYNDKIKSCPQVIKVDEKLKYIYSEPNINKIKFIETNINK